MNKICVYTCITGEYDNLREIKNIENGIDYYCFTNNKKLKSNTWNIVYIEDNSLSNVILARKIKILGHPLINENYDILLWMDAAVEFKKNINDFIDKYLDKKDNFVCFKHGERISILEEMDACLRFRKEKVEVVENLKKFYENENYNYDNGLVESTVLIKRPKNKKVVETMNLWFDMVKNYTKRDQLSFNYCLFKTHLKVKWINEKVFNNDWFKWHEHLSDNYPKSYMIYYGNIGEYNYKYQFSNDYKIDNDIYEIEEEVMYDTDKIYVELSDVPMIKYNIISITKNDLIEYHNTIDYNNYKVFFKKPGFIIIHGNYKKGDKLSINIKFDVIKDFEKYEIINNLINKYVDLDKTFYDLNMNYIKLQEEYNKTRNKKESKTIKKMKSIYRNIKNKRK